MMIRILNAIRCSYPNLILEIAAQNSVLAIAYSRLWFEAMGHLCHRPDQMVDR